MDNKTLIGYSLVAVVDFFPIQLICTFDCNQFGTGNSAIKKDCILGNLHCCTNKRLKERERRPSEIDEVIM